MTKATTSIIAVLIVAQIAGVGSSAGLAANRHHMRENAPTPCQDLVSKKKAQNAADKSIPYSGDAAEQAACEADPDTYQ